MKTYAFLTKDSFRVAVKASNPLAGYRKLKDIPHLADNITDSFIVYNKDGLASLDAWQSLRTIYNDCIIPK